MPDEHGAPTRAEIGLPGDDELEVCYMVESTLKCLKGQLLIPREPDGDGWKFLGLYPVMAKEKPKHASQQWKFPPVLLAYWGRPVRG